MNKMGSRKVYIDEIAGILIFVMVMVHITARADIFGLNHRLLILFYYFMPWFYFKSGFLSKNINSNVPIIKNAAHKLLVPYLKYMCYGCIIGLLLNPSCSFFLECAHSLALSATCSGNIPLWFLLSLFIVKILAPCIFRFASRYEGASKFFFVIVLCVILITIANFTRDNILGKFQWLSHNMLGLVYYIIGVIYQKVKNNKGIISLILVLSIVLVCINYFLLPSFVHMKSNFLECGNYYLWCFSSAGACILFESFMRHKNSGCKLFQLLGRNAMIILCTHWIILNVLSHIVPTTLNTHIRFIIILVILILVEFVFVKVKNSIYAEQ